MNRFRKRSVIVDAFQMTKPRRNDNSEWPEWLNEAWNKSRDVAGALFPLLGSDKLAIMTLEGLLLVEWDDWIIRGVYGELYPCKPYIFEFTYEPVKEEQE